jgi:hypothetical protein
MRTYLSAIISLSGMPARGAPSGMKLGSFTLPDAGQSPKLQLEPRRSQPESPKADRRPPTARCVCAYSSRTCPKGLKHVIGAAAEKDMKPDVLDETATSGAKSSTIRPPERTNTRPNVATVEARWDTTTKLEAER